MSKLMILEIQPPNSECYGSPDLGVPPFTVAFVCGRLMGAFATQLPAVPKQHLPSQRSGLPFCYLVEPRLRKGSHFNANAPVYVVLLLLSGCHSLMKVLELFTGLKELDGAHKILNTMTIHLPLYLSRFYACNIMLTIWIKLNVKQSSSTFSVLIIQLIIEQFLLYYT